MRMTTTALFTLASLACVGAASAQPKDMTGDNWDKPEHSPLNRGLESRMVSQSASGQPGWQLAGSTPQLYELARMAAGDARCGSTVLRSVVTDEARPTRGFATMMQAFRAEAYRGKRVRFSAFVQPQGVQGWSGLWVRVDGADKKKSLAFDNMQERPLRGNLACARYEVVVDVPAEATVIAVGVLLSGQGSVHLGNLRFEAVAKTVPTTDLISARPVMPVLDAPNLALE